MTLNNTILYILGYLAAGKFTVARKLTRVARLKEILAEHSLLPVEDKNLFEIDNTKLTADECTQVIVKYVTGFERRHAT